MKALKKTDDYKRITVEEVLRELGVERNRGLSEEESERRISEYGLNEIPEKEETTLKRILRRFWGPIPWMIEAAAILSVLVQKWEDFTIIIVLLFTNAFIDFWQESKALSALKVLKQKLAKKATVLRDGEFKEIDARFLVPGDIIKLKIGEITPADVKLIEGDFLFVDQSALTGESLPVSKKVGDVAYSNSIVKQGDMLGIVVAIGLDTYFGRTVALVAKAEREKESHFQKAVVKIGNYLILYTVSLAILVLFVAMFRHENLLEIIRFVLVLTVAGIPVAMPAVLSVTMAVGATNLARRQAIVSRLAAIEELAGIDVLCSDKTGTLTKNRMSTAEPITFKGYSLKELMFFAALASQEENKDPIEIPIFEYLRQKGWYDELRECKGKECRVKRFIPFDPVRKRTEAEVYFKGERIVVTKGAPQVVLGLCGEEKNKEIIRKIGELAEKGYRSLGVGFKKGDKFEFVGLIPLFDPPREDSKATIEEAKKLGIDVKMLTGDNLAIARHISEILGIGENILDSRGLKEGNFKEYAVLSEILSKAIYKRLYPEVSEEEAGKFARSIAMEVGNYFERVKLPPGYVKRHESEIIELIENSNGFAQVFPEDKYFIVDKLQKANHIVGMTGDGVNDAPALKKADAGIAVSGGTDAARAAADIVLLSPGLRVIINAIKLARITFERMKSYTIYRVAETLRIVFFMAFSIILFNFYPITAIMIIILALLNDIPILSIAYDNTKLSSRPVKWNMKEVQSIATLLGVLGVISSFTLFYILEEFTQFPKELIQSLIFLKLVIAGHATIYLTRTEKFFWQKPYPSLILSGATFSTRVIGTLIAVYGWFMIPVGWKYAAYIWIYSSLWFVLNDFIKMWAYRRLRRG